MHTELIVQNKSAVTRFKFFPQLNDVAYRGWMNSRSGASDSILECFKGQSLQDKLASKILRESTIPIKEVLECCEFFARIRKDVRAGRVVDLCCGHGLLGVLFAIFEKKTDQVVLLDKVTPPSRLQLISLAMELAPWIQEKIIQLEVSLAAPGAWLEPGSAIVSAHACGRLSDQCIDLAIRSGGPIAILPCCYPRSACPAPLSLQNALGLELAYDVDRTYRLKNSGYHVRWSMIPEDITPMNRVITGKRRNSTPPGNLNPGAGNNPGGEPV